MKTVSSLNRVKKFALSSLLLLATNASFADFEDSSSMKDDLDKIKAYLQNLGMYFGYDLTNYCTTGGSCGSGESAASPGGATSGAGGGPFSNQLTPLTGGFSTEVDLITSFLGALLPSVPASNSNGEQSSVQLIPTTNASLSTYAGIINTYGGLAFTKQSNPYNSPDSGSLSVSSLIDQQPYQANPVNQSLLNMVSTPDISFCINRATGELLDPCSTGALPGPNNTMENNSSLGGGPVLSQVQVMLNTVGRFSQSSTSAGSARLAPGFYVLPKDNVDLVPQLNSDSLLGPLMFDNSGNSQGNNENNQGNARENKGLTAKNQIEQAANYIRYATSAVSPVTQPNKKQYADTYAQATNQTGNVPLKEQLTAQAKIANYISTLRVYTALSSVGISNLYSILSRRMPQEGSNGQKTSQALSEYVMASWRLQPATQTAQGSNPTWTNQINNASSATVQKEIAILLAEINYQLYLSRVQQERLLLTNSTLLLQGIRSSQPNSNLNNLTPGADSETTGSNSSATTGQ